MKSERTPSTAARGVRLSRLASVFAALTALVLLLAAVFAAPVAHSGGTGQALALRAALRALAPAATLRAAGLTAGTRHGTDGRYIYGNSSQARSGAIRQPRVASTASPQVNEAVQTYDVFNPPPAFRPLVGYQGATGLTNDPSNPSVFINNLSPTNFTPVWSADETFIVMSSNRTQTGGIQPDGRFHLWAISINGGQALQITASAGAAGGGEFYPALNRSNLALAFSSDAQSPGVGNLYRIPFSVSTLGAGAPLNISNPTMVTSLTIRTAATGFDQVQRPTFSPSDDQLIVFSAHSISGNNSGHNHLYFLYGNTGGFDPNNTSFPGKLTDGPADDTDPAYSPDGQFIAFASTASAVAADPNNAFGPANPGAVQDPNQSQSLTSAPVATRSLFLLGGGSSANGIGLGQVPPALQAAGGRVTVAGTDDYGPAWSSFANPNQFTNPSGNLAYLAFSRGASAAAPHDIYFFQTIQGVSSPNTETLTPESASPALKLNTDDPTNVYNDTYPSWSPFLSVFSVTYTSNRSVTYTVPANGNPTETAVSITSATGTVAVAGEATGYTVAPAYSGVLISQVLNLDPPTLLRFSTDEVLHVQAAGALDASGNSADPVGGTPNKLAVTGGRKVTLTVRLSDREAGIDDSRVYVQIKDPDSKYQDAQNTEHKVFGKDSRYNGQANQPLSDVTSGTANSEFGTGFPFFESNASPIMKFGYPSYSSPQGNVPVQYINPRGAHGGHWLFPSPNNPDNEYIFVGKGATGTTNPFVLPGSPANSPPFFPGTDPAQFIPLGPEYECQVVNPQFAVGGTGDTTPDTPGVTVANPAGTIGDYVTPYWLAGVDDQGSFSGGVFTGNQGAVGVTQPDGMAQTDRPTADYMTTTTTGGATATTNHPAEWLKLNRIPDAQQDNNGGVLYTVTWTTPLSGSDFYVDVIAYDKAIYPSFPGGTSFYSGHKTNWRIYDNVGGFSTNQSIGNNDILVVSDYALGQKFGASTFGGRNRNLNLVPKQFGTESYLTDVDVKILPDSVYAGMPTSPKTYDFHPVIQIFRSHFAENGLGVESYDDFNIDDGATADGKPNVQSQRYSLWRILSRGPLPRTVLNSYLPQPVAQPAVADAADPAYKSVPAATVLDAPRCVIWLSPYTSDVLSDPGTIDDPGAFNRIGRPDRQSTQTLLRGFVQAGGRLFVTGQDVGSALTISGSSNNTAGGFLSDVLNATLVSPNGGSNVLAATSNRITAGPSYDGSINGIYPTETGTFPSGFDLNFSNFPYLDNLVLGDQDFGDSAFSQIPAELLPGGASVQQQIDTIAPANGAVSAITYNTIGGATALVYHDDPFGLPAMGATAGALPNGGTGSRVVYAAFGLEALSNDYYSSDAPNPSQNPPYDELIPPVLPRQARPGILHNIVSFLRTGRVSGTITQTAGTGQGAGLGIQGVTVYLRPTGAPPSTRALFSATTGPGGAFTISGVEPGTYTLVALKTGFTRAVSNSNVSFAVEGDTTRTGATLTLTPLNPGNIIGKVTDTSGAGVGGATVVFTSTDGQVVTGTTNPDGTYTLPNVPVGTYNGIASKPTFTSSTSQAVTVMSGITSTVNFIVTPGPATVTGTVVDGSGAGIPGATVTFSAGSPQAVVTTATTDGNGAFTVTTLMGGTTYTVVASKTGIGSSAPVTATPTSGMTLTLAPITLTAPVLGTLGGLVTSTSSSAPLGGVTLTIVNTTTGQTTKATTTASTATASDGSAINYGPLTLPTGTYTVSASSGGVSAASQTVTIAANAFTRLDFTSAGGLPPLHTFAAGLNFLSLPYDYSGSSFDSLFGTINTAPSGTTPNGNRSHVAVWNPALNVYALDPNPPADALRLGVGYWIFLKNPVGIGQKGGAPPSIVIVPLTPAWNQIGVPSINGVAVASLTFDMGNGQAPLTFASAVSNQNHVVSPTLYRYDMLTNTYQPVGGGDMLQPWQSYWIKVFVSTTVRIPSGP